MVKKHATCLKAEVLLSFTQEYNYEAFHYVIFSNHVSLSLSYILVFFSVLCSLAKKNTHSIFFMQNHRQETGRQKILNRMGADFPNLICN